MEIVIIISAILIWDAFTDVAVAIGKVAKNLDTVINVDDAEDGQ
jgi:hypothetical protein